NKSIKKAVSLIDFSKLSPDTIARMKINEQRKAMKKLVYEKGKTEGIEQGIEKGVEKGETDMARNLKSRGVDIEIIAQSSGLSIEEIEAL
ncbi:MAG: hypothetical protein GY765_16560, partial [bacterium]|nr:hypothetical protein [bacterium]